MRCTVIPLCVLLVAGWIGSAESAAVYECVGTAGSPSFQDLPCDAGQTQRVVRLPAAPPAPVPAQADALVPDSTAAAEPVFVAPTIRAPDFFLCTRHDGSKYESDDGRHGSSAVPVSMLGLPDGDLAQAYGGRTGIGVSAPGVRPIPQIPAAKVPFAGGYVWVDDVCHHASAQEACTYLRSELDTVQDQLKRAFSDTEAQLKQQQDTLRERMRGC